MTTYLFIDGAYLRRNYADCVRRWFGSDAEIDFQQVKATFGAERAFYYDALHDKQRPNESKEEFDGRVANDEEFFKKIQELDGYFVRLGSMGGRKNMHQKKVDVWFAVEALDYAMRRNMNRAILLTGDVDFEPLVHSLVQLGVRVEVAGDKNTTSQYLRQAADTYKRLSLETYLKWTSGSLRTKFPTTMVRQINALIRPELNAYESGTLRGKKVTLLRQQFDQGYMYYLHVQGFYHDNNSLMLESSDLEKLRLYFELEYGEIEWRHAGSK